MKPFRVRILLEAPWSTGVSDEVLETLRDFWVDGEKYDFLLVWVDTPNRLRCGIDFDRRPESPELISSMIGQGIASCFSS